MLGVSYLPGLSFSQSLILSLQLRVPLTALWRMLWKCLRISGWVPAAYGRKTRVNFFFCSDLVCFSHLHLGWALKKQFLLDRSWPHFWGLGGGQAYGKWDTPVQIYLNVPEFSWFSPSSPSCLHITSGSAFQQATTVFGRDVSYVLWFSVTVFLLVLLEVSSGVRYSMCSYGTGVPWRYEWPL